MERAMDPSMDPERRKKTKPGQQLELPFSESARPVPVDSWNEFEYAIRKACDKLRRRLDGEK